MSRDYTPKEWWAINNMDSTKDICLQNIRYEKDGETHWLYTEEELADRKAHRCFAVTGCNIYDVVRKRLTDEGFEDLVTTLERLIKTDDAGDDISEFPKQMVNWYFNRNGCYYQKTNDLEFLEFVEHFYKRKSLIVKVKDLLERTTVSTYKSNELDMEINLDAYSSLRECCKDIINKLSEDTVFAEAEYNLMGIWKSYKNFTEDDYKYAAACGYEGNWFMEK